MTFGQTIKALRKERNITQEKLAEYLNVSAQAISRWETDITMPEITLLAPIANIFNVTTDYLLGVDIYKRNENIKKVYRNASLKACENTNSRYKNAIAIIRDGLKLYPDSWLLKIELVSYLFVPSATNNQKEYLKNLKEMNAICEDIISNCQDSSIRSKAVYFICSSAKILNNKERAIELAKSMPSYYESREHLMSSLLEGDELKEHIKEGIKTSYISILSGIEILSNGKSKEELYQLYRKYLAIQDVIYDNDDFVKSSLFGSSALSWAESFANVNELDTAFEILNKELERINEIAESTLTSFSPLVPLYISNQIKQKNIEEKQSDLCFRLKEYLKELENDFPVETKSDKRYSEYLNNIKNFISKYER